MPFFYQLVLAKLHGDDEVLPDSKDVAEDNPADMKLEDLARKEEITVTRVVPDEASDEAPLHPDDDESRPPPKQPIILSEDDINEFEGGFLSRSPDPKIRRKLRFETVHPFHLMPNDEKQEISDSVL
jgi:hypothetical protein